MGKNNTCYFDTLFNQDQFYKTFTDVREEQKAGCICLAPVCNLNNNFAVWRPVKNNSFPVMYGEANHFKLIDWPQDAFNHNRTLIAPMPCRVQEEFIFMKARKLPVLLLACMTPGQVKDKPMGEDVSCDVFLVAPICPIEEGRKTDAILQR